MLMLLAQDHTLETTVKDDGFKRKTRRNKDERLAFGGYL